MNLPKTLIVVGGGVIGVEYACMFATLGVRVTIVEKRPRLLEFADTEMVEALNREVDRNYALGVLSVQLAALVEDLESIGADAAVLELRLADGQR